MTAPAPSSHEAVDYYLLRRPKGEPWLEVDIVEVVPRGHAPRCTDCQRYVGSLTWLPPFVARLEGRGRLWPDIGFGGGNDLVLSEHLFQALLEQAPRGLTLRGHLAVDGVDWLGPPPDAPRPAYLLVGVTHARDAVDDFRSGISREDGPPCPTCRLAGVIQHIEGLWFETEDDAATLDFFMARGLPGTVWVAPRVKALWDRLGTQGAEFVPASRYRSGTV